MGGWWGGGGCGGVPDGWVGGDTGGGAGRVCVEPLLNSSFVPSAASILSKIRGGVKRRCEDRCDIARKRRCEQRGMYRAKHAVLLEKYLEQLDVEHAVAVERRGRARCMLEYECF